METFYKAYTKTSQNKTYYFVKKYFSFPEYEDVDDILEGSGMHTDFNKACSIAGINNLVVRNQLLNSIQGEFVQQARVINLNSSEAALTKRIAHWISNRKIFSRQTFGSLVGIKSL